MDFFVFWIIVIGISYFKGGDSIFSLGFFGFCVMVLGMMFFLVVVIILDSIGIYFDRGELVL